MQRPLITTRNNFSVESEPWRERGIITVVRDVLGWVLYAVGGVSE